MKIESDAQKETSPVHDGFVEMTSALDANDPASRARLMEKFRAELLGVVDAVVGYARMLRAEAKDRPPETTAELQKLVQAADKLYAFIKDNIGVDWPEIGGAGFLERLRHTRHIVGNRLNEVQGHCQFLLEDERERHFGALVDDLERIKSYCKSCQGTLQRFRTGDSERDEQVYGSTKHSEILSENVIEEVRAELDRIREDPAWVLVVDDSDAARELLVRFLQREGHHVAVAKDGQQALELVSQRDFDLILLDFIMPEMSGIQVLRRLKSEERWKHIPVIMVSALEEVSDIAPCIELGADDFLCKPVEFTLLRARVVSCLQKKRLRERELGQFFTPELARHIVRHPEILWQAQDVKVTLLFCDIRGFSRISERLSPADTVAWTRGVMSELSQCVIKHEGVLVEIVGDELMGMWGAPQEEAHQADLACRAATDMISRRAVIDKKWLDLIGEPTEFGIGINTGVARVGNTGPGQKIRYGPLGSVVNLASRVQGATKYLGSPILITDTTRNDLNWNFSMRKVCTVRVTNIHQPVDLYELALSSETKHGTLGNQYEQALQLFEQGEMAQAVAILGQLLSVYPNDGPSLLLMSRAVEAQLHADEKVDPVWELPGK